MVKMNFRNPTLEKVVRGFKWTRNNTIQIFEQAKKEDILDFISSGESKKYTFQPILYQFQCIVTTTDRYYRSLIKHKDQQFGVLIREGNIIDKDVISQDLVCKVLKEQLVQLETLLKNYNDKEVEKNIKDILAILNHEYLHQGQFILMFREAGVELPERFKKAWAL